MSDVAGPEERGEGLRAEDALSEVLRAVVPWRQERGHRIGGEWAADIIVGLRRLGFDVSALASLPLCCRFAPDGLCPLHGRVVATPAPDTGAEERLRAALDEATFDDLLTWAEALLTKYPPDTIVCSHYVKADIGARTVAGIADLVASCRSALSGGSVDEEAR